MVMPISRPSASKRPPPLEPGESAALVYSDGAASDRPMADTRPALTNSSNPSGFPTAYTRSPTFTSGLIATRPSGSVRLVGLLLT